MGSQDPKKMAQGAPDWRKMLRPFVGRAKETKQAEPCISYYCLKYAAEKAMELYKATGDQECRAEVSKLLDQCQSSTVDMTDVEGRAYCEEFAIKLFGNLDAAEKAGGANKRMAGQFLVASTFFEILRQFDPDGELDSKMQEMQTYACWKAAQIAKCVKQGTIPPPGPKGWTPEPDAAPAEGFALPCAPPPHPAHPPPPPPDMSQPLPGLDAASLGLPTIPDGDPLQAQLASLGQPSVNVSSAPPPSAMPLMQPTMPPATVPITPQVKLAPASQPAANVVQLGTAPPPSRAGATSLGFSWPELKEIVDLQKQATAVHRVLAKGYEDVPEAKKLLKELLPSLQRLASVQSSLTNTGQTSA